MGTLPVECDQRLLPSPLAGIFPIDRERSRSSYSFMSAPATSLLPSSTADSPKRPTNLGAAVDLIGANLRSDSRFVAAHDRQRGGNARRSACSQGQPLMRDGPRYLGGTPAGDRLQSLTI